MGERNEREGGEEMGGQAEMNEERKRQRKRGDAPRGRR